MTDSLKYFLIILLIATSGFALFVIFKSFVIWVIAVVAVMIMSLVWSSRMVSGDSEKLRQWASQNGLQLLECERKWGPGPFGWWIGRGSIYFRFVINDPQVGRRVGWAEFDHTLLGGGRMDVKWVAE